MLSDKQIQQAAGRALRGLGRGLRVIGIAVMLALSSRTVWAVVCMIAGVAAVTFGVLVLFGVGYASITGGVLAIALALLLGWR